MHYRIIIAVSVGLFLHLITFYIFIILAVIVTGWLNEYIGLSQTEIVNIFTQKPEEALKFGTTLLLAMFISLIISSFISGLIARKNSLIAGMIVSSMLPIMGFLGSISRGSLQFRLDIMVYVAIMISIGALFGYLGGKLRSRYL